MSRVQQKFGGRQILEQSAEEVSREYLQEGDVQCRETKMPNLRGHKWS
jgi:hypothetical protein